MIEEAEYEVIDDTKEVNVNDALNKEEWVKEYHSAMKLITSFIYLRHRETGQDLKKIIRNTLEKEVLTLVKLNKGTLEEFYDNYRCEVQEADDASHPVQ